MPSDPREATWRLLGAGAMTYPIMPSVSSQNPGKLQAGSEALASLTEVVLWNASLRNREAHGGRAAEARCSLF